MAYVKIDNDKKAILKHNDNRPARLYVNGELMTDISYIDKTTEQDTYTSEYKANLIGLELQGNTEQNPNVSPTTPQTIKNSGDYSSIDYTSQIMDLIKGGEYSQAGVSGVALVNVPSELVDKNITYYLSASLPSGYSIGLLKGSNFLFGDSVDITTIPITKSGFDSIYINGINSFEEIPALFDNVTLYAIEEQEGVKGIDVELSGANLFDTKAFVENAQANGLPKTSIYEIDNGIFVKTYAGQENYTGIDFGFKKGTQYTCSFDVETTEISGNAVFKMYFTYTDGTALQTPYIQLTNVGFKQKVTIVSDINKSVEFIKVGAWQYRGAINITNIMLVEGTQSLPYQPYFTPVTVNIPSEVTLTDGTVVPLRFAKYKNADYLLLNNKQVKYFSYSTEGDPTKPISEQVENVPPIEYDLTLTEVGQNLLALAEATQNTTNVITATSEIPLSKKIITYAKWGGDSEN